MRRIIYIVIIIVAAVAVAAFFFSKFSRNTSGGPSTVGQSGFNPPDIGPGLSKKPTGDAFDIGTPMGIVRVKNFYDDVVSTEEGSLVLKEADGYKIGYDTRTSFFRISIWKPLAVVRQPAEKDFLDLLGIRGEDACRLSVSFIVPKEIDVNLAGKNVGLSSCSNIIQSN